MALGGFYNTGTVTIASGGLNVTGVGSLWSMQIEVGDWLLVGGQVGVVLVVTDDTHLTLATAWQGTLPSAAAYVILKMSWLRYDPALTQAKIRELLAELIEQGNFVFTSTAPPDPALGTDGQWALKTDTTPWRVWYKTGGVWVEQQPAAGLAWKGAWSSATTYQKNDAVSSGGSSYISKTTNTNKPPASSPSDWDLMASQGGTGAPGSAGPPGPVGMVWKGAWSSATAYAINDAVSYQGNSYIAVAANTNSVPPNANWNLLAQGGSGSALPVLQEFTATAGQTTFTVSTGYTAGKIWVTRDGVVQDFADYTATNGSTVVFVTPCEAGEVVKVMGNLDTKNGAIITRFRYIATAGQTTFSGPDANGQTLTYQSSAAIEVFAKGALLPSTAYTATSGTSVILGTALAAGDVMEVVAFAYTQMSDGVSYLGAQTLTAVQQTQARANIYAAPFDAMSFGVLNINGAADVDQEAKAPFALVSGSEVYVFDGWRAKMNRAATLAINATSADIETQIGGQPIQGFKRALLLQAVTGLASLAAGDYVYVAIPIEGYRVVRLGFGKANPNSVTIGFWYNGSLSGTMTATLQNAAGNRSCPVNIAVVGGDSAWRFYTATFSGDNIGTWLYTNGVGLLLILCFGCGSTGQGGVSGQWAANGFFATPATSNFFASTAWYVGLTGVCVLAGIDAPPPSRSPLLMRTFDQELALCRRYWRTSYNYGVVPGTASASAGAYTYFGVSVPSGQVASVFGEFSPVMRGNPTMTIYSDVTGVAGKARDATQNADITGGFLSQGSTGFLGYGVSVGNLGLCTFHWTADARF